MSAFTTLFPSGIPTRPQPRVRKRRAPCNNHRFTRRVKAGAWQARVWLGPKERELNLGLFTITDHPADPGRPDDEMAEWAAARAAREFVKYFRPHEPGHGLRETLTLLKQKAYIPQSVLPPRVVKKGENYIGRIKKRGRLLETREFPDEWAAYHSVCDLLDREFPPQPSKSELARLAREAENERPSRFIDLTSFIPTRSVSAPSLRVDVTRRTGTGLSR